MASAAPGTPDHYMERALGLARESAAEGEVPVGAVLVVSGGRRLFEGRNRTGSRSPLAHAEMETLKAALADCGAHGLGESVLYVTLEPCLMCLGAMVHARIGGLVYGCPEPRFGGVAALQALWKEGRYPHRFPILAGPREEEARGLLQAYFRARR
jgi:tRNA(adenine34) deaminase